MGVRYIHQDSIVVAYTKHIDYIHDQAQDDAAGKCGLVDHASMTVPLYYRYSSLNLLVDGKLSELFSIV